MLVLLPARRSRLDVHPCSRRTRAVAALALAAALAGLSQGAAALTLAEAERIALERDAVLRQLGSETLAMRERLLTRSQVTVPHGSPLSSTTSTPRPSGSCSARAISARISSGVEGRTAARNVDTSGWETRSASHGTSPRTALRSATSVTSALPRRAGSGPAPPSPAPLRRG